MMVVVGKYSLFEGGINSGLTVYFLGIILLLNIKSTSRNKDKNSQIDLRLCAILGGKINQTR